MYVNIDMGEIQLTPTAKVLRCLVKDFIKQFLSPSEGVKLLYVNIVM